MDFREYDPESSTFYDEMFVRMAEPRPGFEPLAAALQKRQAAAERALLSEGVTFTLNGEGRERIFPFDIIPRVLTAPEWEVLEAGLRQRIEALNLVLADVYGERRIVRDGVVPEYLEDVHRVPSAVRRTEAASWHLVPRHGNRSGARPRWSFLRA
jgi:uncharacterized circularly permuted ATP-grasp superfamily protein